MWYVKPVMACQAGTLYIEQNRCIGYKYNMCWYSILLYRCTDHRGHDRMIVQFTTIYVMSTYHH